MSATIFTRLSFQRWRLLPSSTAGKLSVRFVSLFVWFSLRPAVCHCVQLAICLVALLCTIKGGTTILKSTVVNKCDYWSRRAAFHLQRVHWYPEANGIKWAVLLLINPIITQRPGTKAPPLIPTQSWVSIGRNKHTIFPMIVLFKSSKKNNDCWLLCWSPLRLNFNWRFWFTFNSLSWLHWNAFYYTGIETSTWFPHQVSTSTASTSCLLVWSNSRIFNSNRHSTSGEQNAKHKERCGSMTWRPSVYCGSLLYKLISSGSSRSPRHTTRPSPTLTITTLM